MKPVAMHAIVEQTVHARLEEVTRTYPAVGNNQPVRALGPVSLELRRGEFFAVVGPSGCGKSTLLEVLAGLQPASTGKVVIEGNPVTGQVPDGIGIVFQEDASFAWLTVWDNVAFGMRRSGADPAETARRTNDALAFMGLRDFANAYPVQLSGGMRQRVCIARTLVLQPRLILLDEPFGALDAQTRLLMGDEVLRLWRSTGCTILLITHALDEAAMLADRIGRDVGASRSLSRSDQDRLAEGTRQYHRQRGPVRSHNRQECGKHCAKSR